MDIPKLIVKIETEQGDELATISVRADILGRWISEQGHQLEAIAQAPVKPASPLPKAQHSEAER